MNNSLLNNLQLYRGRRFSDLVDENMISNALLSRPHEVSGLLSLVFGTKDDGVSTAIASGNGQIIDKGNTSDHGNKYRTNIAAKDIVDLVMCVYVVRVISDAVIQVGGSKGVKKNVSAKIGAAMAAGGKGKKSVSVVAHDLDENIKFATPKMDDVVKNIVTGYTDSVYALVEIANGGRAPLPSKNDEKANS